jgi:hypothetical protein
VHVAKDFLRPPVGSPVILDDVRLPALPWPIFNWIRKHVWINSRDTDNREAELVREVIRAKWLLTSHSLLRWQSKKRERCPNRDDCLGSSLLCTQTTPTYGIPRMWLLAPTMPRKGYAVASSVPGDLLISYIPYSCSDLGVELFSTSTNA